MTSRTGLAENVNWQQMQAWLQLLIAMYKRPSKRFQKFCLERNLSEDEYVVDEIVQTMSDLVYWAQRTTQSPMLSDYDPEGCCFTFYVSY